MCLALIGWNTMGKKFDNFTYLINVKFYPRLAQLRKYTLWMFIVYVRCNYPTTLLVYPTAVLKEWQPISYIITVDYQIQIHVRLIMAKYRVAVTLDRTSLTLKLFAAYLLSEF